MENSPRPNLDYTTIIEETCTDYEGQTKTQQYSRKRLLGKGGFARVYEVINLETSELQAAKVVSKATVQKPRVRQKLMNEIKIHRSLSHRNVVRFERVFEDSSNIYILLELCPNQTLSELVKRRKNLTEPEAKTILVQVAAGLKYIHSCKVIHRDIKLGNIFLDEKMDIKIGDFGLATKVEFEGQRKTTICGTPNYISPEILSGNHSYETDIWSLGVLLYTLLVGIPPFNSVNAKLTYKRISKSAFSFPSHLTMSEDARHLIEWILSPSPETRPSLDEITQHPFFTSTDFPIQLPHASLAVPPSTLVDKPRISVETPDLVRKDSFIEISPRGAVSPSAPQKTVSVSSFRNQKFWVKKWVDYSNKYGLVYLLSDDVIGVNFNDSTRILNSGNLVIYTHRVGLSRVEETIEFRIGKFPETFAKKVGLLQHFKKQFVVFGNMVKRPHVYVEKWLKTSHAIVFRLSNHIAQTHFNDSSELIVYLKEKSYAYLDKKGNCLEGALDGNYSPSVLKRIKYVKDVLNTVFKSAVKAEISPKNKFK